MPDSKVFPSEPVPQHTIKLSICDAYSPKLWVTQTLFWPSTDSSNESFQRSFEALKQGLSRTLHEIPALAGHIARASDDPRDLVVSVEAGAHVDFTCEDLSTKEGIPSYATLRAEGFPMTDLRIPFSPPITLVPVSEGAPMFTAKLNRLEGGVGLSFGFNHLFADAATVAEVERMWSCHTADVSCERTTQSHKPAIDDQAVRQQLSASQEGVEEFQDEHWKVFPTDRSQLYLPRQAVSAEAAMTMLQEAKNTHLAALNGALGEPKWCIWRFTPDSLMKLKKDASSAPDATKWISTMDALIGLFWSRLTSNKQKSRCEGYQTANSSLCFPINIRQRLQPPVHAQYLGNAVDIVCTECPLTELESDEKGLTAAAQSVRRAVGGWTQSKWAAWLTMACSLPADQAICPNPLMLLEAHNMGFNDYSRAHSHVLDWGHELGIVERTRYMKPAASMAECATAVVVHPRLRDGGLEVATTSTDEVRLALEEDGVFRGYAELVCAFA